MWLPKPADRMVRHPRLEEMGPIHLTAVPRKARSRLLAYPLILLYVFVGLTMVGTGLLELPISTRSAGIAPVMTAFFTATSAITVTGLVIEETAFYWTRFGQTVILALIFVGGTGYMIIATFLMVLFRRQLQLSQLIVRNGLGVNYLGNLARLSAAILAVALVIQLAGFVFLLFRFLPIHTPAESVWQAVFHSISAFNNAGFVALTEPGGLMAFKDDALMLGTLALLIVLGGISYWVIFDVTHHRRFSRLTLNTKLVLILTAFLLTLGTVAVLAGEFTNPNTLGPEPIYRKVMLSFFESVNSRTAGFTVMDMGSTGQQTQFFLTSLMFIGGATGSVAGGIKVATVGVILLAVWSTMQGRHHVFLFGREIPQIQVHRAVAIGMIAAAFVFTMALLLTFSENQFDFIDLFFETVSAFSTVGLSTGLTPDISSLGHLILIITMVVGRLGPFALAFTLANRPTLDLYRHPQEVITLG